MIRLAKSYNKIALDYDHNSDAFNLLTSSRFSALQEIEQQLQRSDQPTAIIDLGIGSGVFLTQLQEKLKNTDLTGVDISKQMLTIAKSRLRNLRTIRAAVDNIDSYLQGATFDLIIAHFILAYVDITTLLTKCNGMIKEHGLISIVTTTHESFPHFRNHIHKKIATRSSTSRIIQDIYNTAMQKTLIPKSYAVIQQKAEDFGFTILNRKKISTDIFFVNATGMADFAVKGGWLLNALDYPFLPTKLSYKIVKNYFNRNFEFPWKDKHIVESVLLKKIP